MDDLLIIPKSVFYENANKFEVVPNKIVLDILALDCFNETSKTFVAHVSKKTTYTHTPKQHFPKPQVRKVLSYHDKILREITGSMNKINESNYERVLNNIIKIVDLDNVEMVCIIILEKSIVHSIYMTSFITLFVNIHNIFPDQVFSVLETYVKGFVKECSCVLSELKKLDKDNYDDFCLYIKKKNSIINKTKLVCELIKSFNIEEMCYNPFWELLLSEVDSELETVIFEIIVIFTYHCGDKSIQFKNDLQLEVDIDTLKYTKSKFIYKDLINDTCNY